jgi:hypothetical protein
MELKNVSLEVQLLGWKKSTSKQPPTITLALHSDFDMEFFENLTVAKGKNAGQIMEAGFILSPDDPQHGMPESIEQVKKETKGKKPLSISASDWMAREKTKMRPSQFAAMTCKEPEYGKWLNSIDENNEGDPVTFMQLNCDVFSRAEFDLDHDALVRFENHLNDYRNFINA